jgi:16S rRNA processing protein RimM
MNYYIVGKLLTTHGLKGELKLQVETDFDRFKEDSRLYIGHKGEYIEVFVKYAKDYQNGLLIVFKDLEDINLVEHFKGDYLYISEEDQGEAPEGMNYIHDIIGKKVYNQNGELKGTCVDMQEGSSSYMMIVSDNKKTYKIPFIRGVFINKVDDEGIHMNEIEGLF